MKKWLLSVLLCLMCCALCCPAVAEEEPLDPDSLLAQVLLLVEDGAELIRLTEDDLLDLIGIEPQEYTDFVYLAAPNALTGREIIVLQATDEEAAKRVAELLQGYLEQRMEEMRNYLPEVYQILSRSEVFREKMLVVLSMAAPAEDEAQLLLETLNKE